MRPLLAVGGVVLLTACGGGVNMYAGLTEYEAAGEAVDLIARDVVKPNSPIRGLEPRLTKVVRSDNGEGDDAWVGVFQVGKKKPVCVWIWADQEVLRTTYNYFIDACPRHVLRAEAGEIALR